MSTITKLEIENFKRISAVSIQPDGSAVVLGGRNAQGKSSVLDAIQAALGGKRHAPQDPIRHGAKGAKVALETESFTVTRKWSAKRDVLEVTSKDGAKYSSPQKMLDELLVSLSFDPSAFARMDPKKQAEVLRQLVGLDFTKEDAARKEYFDQRTEVNRECRRLQGALEKLPEPPADTPEEEVTVEDLNEELERCIQHNRKRAAKVAELDRKRNNATALVDRIEETKKGLAKFIADTEAEIARMEAELAEMSSEGKALRAEVDAMPEEDEDGARQALMNAIKVNAAVRAKAERAKLEAELNEAIEKSEQLTKRIEEVDHLKAHAAAKATYPIDGLELIDDQVYLEGVPWEQASQAQQLKASVAMGLALNPELKVLLIRDGSYLDSGNLAMIAEMAAAAGGQVWVERVSEDGKGCTVVIEDGAVAQTKEGAA